jgi:hypothetical protein
MIKQFRLLILLIPALFILASACKKTPETPVNTMQLIKVTTGISTLQSGQNTAGVLVGKPFLLVFNTILDTSTVRNSITLRSTDNIPLPCTLSFQKNFTEITLVPVTQLSRQTSYILEVAPTIKGSAGETFAGASYPFFTEPGIMKIDAITVNGNNFQKPAHPANIEYNSITIRVQFSDPIDTIDFSRYFVVSPNMTISAVLSDSNKTVTLTNNIPLQDYFKYYLDISKQLKSANGYVFGGFNNFFFTVLDSTPKFPVVSDDELLTIIQHQTFRYFYDYAEPTSGMARERNYSGNLVTMGGSGFGVMALIVGMERGFITRTEGTTRLAKILHFLETCDRFHGVWPHWLYGNTGKVHPFSTNDDGGDLVETSYMVQGLLTMRQYLQPGTPGEQELIDRINVLLDGVEYDWYTRGQNVLYWHWSPNVGWAMNMPIRGYNEALIAYIAASTSALHPITKEVYQQGYAQNGSIQNGNSYYGIVLPLGEPYGGPLFFTQYSYLGLDPRNLSDDYANYWEQNVNQSMINYSYCVANPLGWVGYSTAQWGLTASDNPYGYSAQSPTNDLGTISPTAAVSALPYTPVQSMAAIRFFYYQLGDRLFGAQGFYDAYDVTENWWSDAFLAIDQGPQICMIENYRTGLLWNLFMSCPEVHSGLTKLGFTYK